MKGDFSQNYEFPACGYGLSGLCCSACLHGPCRISPFDRDTERGRCGASADRLVAENLLRMIAFETAARLVTLTEIVNLINSFFLKHSSEFSPNQEAVGAIVNKYSLNSTTVEKTESAVLLAGEIENLLSTTCSAHDSGPFWSRLYPANIFPQFYSEKILPKTTLTIAGLAAFELFLRRDMPLDEILRMCLQVSLVYLICEELIEDLEILKGKTFSLETKKIGEDTTQNVAQALSLGGVLLLKTPHQEIDRIDRKIQAFCEQWRGPVIEISRPGRLLDIGREFYRQCSRPLADMAPLVVAQTSSAALIVGILTCGYTAVSWPGLPLFGSEKVRRFFCEALKETIGSIYLLPDGGDILSVVQNRFREKP